MPSSSFGSKSTIALKLNHAVGKHFYLAAVGFDIYLSDAPCVDKFRLLTGEKLVCLGYNFSGQGSATGRARTWPIIRSPDCKLLVVLVPADVWKYRISLGSKKRLFKSVSALSTVGGSPGRSLLYSSINASSRVRQVSLSRVAVNALVITKHYFKLLAVVAPASPPDMESHVYGSSVGFDIAFKSQVMGSFLFLSTRTWKLLEASVSYSSQAPL